MYIIDFKTGKSFSKWEGLQGYDAIKARQYMFQLAFYKLLLQNDKEYSSYNIKELSLYFLDEEDENLTKLSLEVDDQLLKRVENLSKIVFRLIKELKFDIGKEYIKEDMENKNVRDIIAFEDFLLTEYKHFL